VSSVAPEQRPQPHPSVETAFLAPEAVLWDGRHHHVHHLNPSASAVWLLIDGEMSADQIAVELCDIFGTEYAVVRPDVDVAIAEFARRGLLVGGDQGHEHRDASHDDVVDGDHEPGGDPAAPASGATPLARPPDP
jgi:Coenzyme PQQ synthesis protein D (PqqD)